MDRDALESLIRIHQAALYRYLRYLGAAPETAEDLVQETFLAAYQSPNPPAADDEGGWAAWLRGIARNRFLSHCRRRRRSPVTVDEAAVARAESCWVGEFLREGDGFDYVEALRRCVDKLSERHRTALDLRYTQRQSRSEMARSWQMTENGVKALLRRIRETLANCVRQEIRTEQA